MPPIYPYQDELTEYTIELYRPFGGNEKMPEDDELPEEERGKPRKWKRLIGGNIKTTRVPGWGAKGHW